MTKAKGHGAKALHEGRHTLRMPRALYEQSRAAAKLAGVAWYEYVNTAVCERLAQYQEASRG